MINRVAVLLPTYNRRDFILFAVRSILEQTHKEISLIVYDDGSTDDTAALVGGLMTKDERIRLIKGDRNEGVAFARNRLLEAAAGAQFACWQDSDDISNVHRIECELAAIKAAGTALVFTQHERFNSKDFICKIQAPQRWKAPPHSNSHGKPGFATTMFQVAAAPQFDETKKLGGEDWDWIDRLKSLHGEPEFLRKVLYYVRDHDDRIGAWKRRLAHLKGTPAEAQRSYAAMTGRVRA